MFVTSSLAHLTSIGLPTVAAVSTELVTSRCASGGFFHAAVSCRERPTSHVEKPSISLVDNNASGQSHMSSSTIAEGVEIIQKRMEVAASSAGLSSARFLSVEPDYYGWTLEQRRDRLGAGSVDELCKSVVMENTQFGKDGAVDSSSDPRRIQRILVLVQYVAKLHKEKLHRVVRDVEVSRGLPALGKRQYNFRLLEAEECARLTGFEHNAVTPIGLGLPVFISDKISSLSSGQFWLGGGHIDLKLNLSTAEAEKVFSAVVGDITA